MSTQFQNAFAKGVSALVESAKDQNDEVREHIASSLLSLAQKDFGVVLDVICKFLLEHKSGQTPVHQRITLLRSIRKIILEYDEEVGDRLMGDLVACCVTDMTAQLDINSPWQQTACQVVVDLMCINPGVCTPHVIQQIPGTSLPHYFIMNALSNAATQRPVRFVAHMRDCMAKVLPILGMAKQDNVRFMMSDALASFAESIHQLDSLPELSPRSKGAAKLKVDDFSEGMYTALSLLVNDWSAAKELKVRSATAMAMGKLSHVVQNERLEERLPQLVKLLVTAVKREKPKDLLQSLKGMTSFIQAAMTKLPSVILPHLESLWGAIFQQIVTFNGQNTQDQTDCMKNHQELMLSVEAMSMGACNTVLTFIQGVLDVKFGSKDVIARCAALGVIRHLVQRQHLDPHLSGLKNNVIAIVRTCLDDTDLRMKKTIIQTVMAMGAAATNNYLACEGAEVLVQYVILHAATPPHAVAEYAVKNKKLIDMGQPGLGDLKELASSVLSLFHSTLANLDVVLWPFILEIIGLMPTKPELFYAFPIIVNIICSVSKRLGNSHDFYFDFDRMVNVPRPEALITCFVVMMSQPQHLGREVTATVVRAMEALAPLLDEPMKKGNDGSQPIGSLWLGILPEIRAYIESGEFKQEDYEDACHNLFKKTTSARKDEAWVQALGTSLGTQLPLYTPASVPADFMKERHDFKRVALSMFGLVLSKANLKTYVTDSINLLVETTDHTNEAQRVGCAKALGSIASQHTDNVLDKVNKIAKPPKASGGGFFSKKVETGPDRDFGELSRATALLAYGHISRKANQSLFTSRIETHVVPTYLEMVGQGKNPVVKIASLVCQNMMGNSLRKCYEFTFTSKTNVMQAVIGQMLVEPTQYAQNDLTAFNLLSNGYSALIPLTYLEPACDEDLLSQLRQCMSAGICKEWAVAEGEEINEPALQKQLGLLGGAMLESSKDIVQSLIRLGDHLAPFVTDANPIRRERAVRVYITLLKQFGKQCDHKGITVDPVTKGPVELDGGASPVLLNVVVKEDPKAKKKAEKKPDKKTDKKGQLDGPVPEEVKELSLGTIIGRLLPRLSDESVKTKYDALEGISFCIKLHMMITGHDASRALDSIKSLNGKLDYKTEADVVLVMKEVTAALASFLAGSKELPNIVEELVVKGLLDPVEDSTVAVCAILSGLVKALGGAPQGQEPSLNDEECKLFVHKLIVVLNLVKGVEGRENTHRGVLLAIRALAKNRPSLIFNELLVYPVPHAEGIVSVVQTIASDTGLSRLITNHCLDVLLNAQLFDSGYKSGAKNLSICASVVSASCTLGEVFGTGKGAEVAKQLQAALLSSILLLVSASHEAPKVEQSEEQKKRGFAPCTVPPAQLVKKTLEVFTTVVYSDSVTDRFVEGFWDFFCDNAAFPYATACLLTAITHASHPEGNTDMDIKLGKDPVTVLPPTTACTIVEELYEFIVTYVQKVYDSHRRCAMVVLGQLLYHCQESQPLLQGIINALLSRAGIDEQLVIKLQATQGFTHIPVHKYDAIKLFVAPVIGSLVSCCGDPALEVCLAAMGTLEALIQRIVCKQELSAVVVNVCLRTKSALDSPDQRVRAAGCSLFGVMAKLAVEGTIEYNIMEPNVYGHIAGILVHVNDEEVMVRNACKQTLHDVVGYFKHAAPSKKAHDHLTKLFDKEHMSPSKQTNYDEFANEFSKIWVRFYAHKVNDLLVGTMGYFQSTWAAVRAAAAIFNGTLLRHLSDTDQARSNLESSTQGLIALMRSDKSPNVRVKAAKALGMLGDMQ